MSVSASIPSVRTYPNVGIISYHLGSNPACSATFGNYTGSNVSCTASGNKITCSATFDVGSGFTPNNTTFRVTCNNATMFEATITCSAQLIGTTTVTVTETSS